MQTPSEPKLKDGSPKLEWAARSEGAKRSVFGNYRADDLESSSRRKEALTSFAGNPEGDQSLLTSAATKAGLQTSIDLALARAFIHRFLAKAYEDPTFEAWHWLTDAQTIALLRSATAVLGSSLSKSAEALINALQPDALDSFHSAYLAAFGHAARGQCPLNEIEYGDLKADPLFQPHRLADLAAFYCAFGLEVAGDADERQDHICLELEFTCVLAAKEAYALENQLDAEELALCRNAQKKFLREHLGRWTPAFARRLAGTTTDAALGALAEFTRVFIESECARFAVNPGGEDLLLRPVDEAAESMCASCGIPGLPPGALPTT
ncbi:MAG TPA: molecular chaperone TorD family protein [Verrucomicrobiae bacterium]